AIYYDYASDLGTILMAQQTYERHFNDDGVSGLALYVSETSSIDSVIANIQMMSAGRQALDVHSNRMLRETSLNVFDRTFTITIVLRLLALFIAFVGVLSALMALQLEKGRELAILRANGLTPRQVWSYVTRQTGFMGLMAGLFSIPLGLLLAYILIFVINQRSFGWTLQMSIEPFIFVQAVVLAVIAALLAGVYPAIKMSTANPTRALRDE
ncbi:MAG: FtsX-like permease family protein, partial [Rhodothermales bacterium]|nr:FtsX-like permease family protein [Rhodothermales bacterium]